MLDAVGNTIPEGSYLAWAVRVGSCYAAMRVGKVLCATSTPDKNSYGGGSNNRISVLVVTKHWASEALYVRKTTPVDSRARHRAAPRHGSQQR